MAYDYDDYLNRYADVRAAVGSSQEGAKQHYDTFGAKEGRTLKQMSTPAGQSDADDYFDTNKFEQLLGRLEGSKGRQQRQKSVEGRRDIFSQGLAGMMSNF